MATATVVQNGEAPSRREIGPDHPPSPTIRSKAAWDSRPAGAAEEDLCLVVPHTYEAGEDVANQIVSGATRADQGPDISVTPVVISHCTVQPPLNDAPCREELDKAGLEASSVTEADTDTDTNSDASSDRTDTGTETTLETETQTAAEHLSNETNLATELHGLTRTNTPGEPDLPPLPLLNAMPISFSSAADSPSNMLVHLKHVPLCIDLYRQLWADRKLLAHLVLHHTGRLGGYAYAGRGLHNLLAQTSAPVAHVLRPSCWIRGSFNVCIPVDVFDAPEPNGGPRKKTQILLRCGLPFKQAEAAYSGSMDEKLGCEVAVYSWMQAHCVDVPIPHLYGFGFLDGSQFTHVRHRIWPVRVWHTLRGFLDHLSSALRLLKGRRATHHDDGPQLLSAYTPHASRPTPSAAFPTTYMVIEAIATSPACRMLSHTLPQLPTAPEPKRTTLFRDLAHVILALARIPMPRIGSLRFDVHSGRVALTNRPLACNLAVMESEGVPRMISPHRTYNAVTPYVTDLLAQHDARLAVMPNLAGNGSSTAVTLLRQDMAGMAAARILAHRFAAPTAREHGPFVLQHMDLHASNVLVDDDTWSIRCLIDLEWICVLPLDALTAPSWLTQRTLDMIQPGSHLDAYADIHREFVRVFAEEEAKEAEHIRRCKANASAVGSLARIMEDNFASGASWFWHGLQSINAAPEIVLQHLCHHFSGATSLDDKIRVLSDFWTPDPEDFVQRKIAVAATYRTELRAFFNSEVHRQAQENTRDATT